MVGQLEIAALSQIQQKAESRVTCDSTNLVVLPPSPTEGCACGAVQRILKGSRKAAERIVGPLFSGNSESRTFVRPATSVWRG
jgi:hypothetical protein